MMELVEKTVCLFFFNVLVTKTPDADWWAQNIFSRLEPQYSVFSYRKWSIKRRYSNKRSSRISAAALI